MMATLSNTSSYVRFRLKSHSRKSSTLVGDAFSNKTLFFWAKIL